MKMEYIMLTMLEHMCLISWVLPQSMVTSMLHASDKIQWLNFLQIIKTDFQDLFIFIHVTMVMSHMSPKLPKIWSLCC